jgi:2-polyprenyl-3-methyl-5-hydroxy-6-metoxy-1,4-benzoquinol methylase
MNTLSNCPYCLSTTIKNILITKDYFLTKESFNIDKCDSCGLTFTNPQPSENEIHKYYQSDNYVSHGAKRFSLFDNLYIIARSFSLKWKLSIIRKKLKHGKILDYGCGTGEFLNHCSLNGYTVIGIEPSARAREQASLKLGQRVFESIEEIPNKKFDIITLWHVLEHIHDISSILEKLKEKLTETGTILIAVPNHNSKDCKIYRKFWAAYDTPRHLWHFDQSSMTKLLKKENFILEKIIPMKMDSYYVSILSEKYKNGGSLKNILNGLIIGYKSNKEAKLNNEYSSLIYLATRK